MTNLATKVAIGFTVICLSLVGSANLRADSLSSATSRSGFNDTALWPGTCQQGLSSVAVSSSNGVTVTATDAGGYIDTDTQVSPGCSYDGWFGNFTPGDNILYTAGNGPITLTFSSPVSGVGTQFQQNLYGDFTAQIQLYNGATLLGTFTEAGDSNGNGDNSAIFLGAIDSTGADITSAVFSLTGGVTDFSINDVSLLDGVVTTPEPGSIVLLGIGLLGLMGMGLRRRRLA